MADPASRLRRYPRMQSGTVGRRNRHPGAGFLGRTRWAAARLLGRIVWDVDTKGDYQTVNGVAAKGGSIDGGGAVVVDGTVYVGSGSGIYGGMPGNALLAYSVDGL